MIGLESGDPITYDDLIEHETWRKEIDQEIHNFRRMTHVN